MRVRAIDPGKHLFGWADAVDGLLVACGHWHVNQAGELPPADYTVVECPQQRGPNSRVRVQELIDLAMAGGAAAGPHYVPVLVSRWKGSRSKAGMHASLRIRLSAVEQIVIEELDVKASVKHNVLDAVCLLLWQLRR